MGLTSKKGDLGVAKIIAEVMERGYKVALPIGEDWPFDIIVLRHGKLERVQCKYTESNGEFVEVRCRSISDWVCYKYTSDMIDWIATYDATSRRCYFIPAAMLGTGRAAVWLRLKPPRNNQKKGINLADDYLAF